MASFTGKNISSTFNSILNIGTTDQQCFPNTGQCIVTDGTGVCSSLSLGCATLGITVTGSISGTGIVSGSSICSTGTICGGAGTLNSLAVTTTSSLGTATATTLLTTCNATVSGNATVAGTITVNGDIRGCSDIIAFYSSDCRLKDDLNVICNTQSIINSLTGYSFTWNEESNREGSDLGVIAQDVQEVLPSIVKERDNGYLAVDYIKLIPVLIEEVKRLGAEVEQLKSIQTF